MQIKKLIRQHPRLIIIMPILIVVMLFIPLPQHVQVPCPDMLSGQRVSAPNCFPGNRYYMSDSIAQVVWKKAIRSKQGSMCIGVITPARNILTRACSQFSTPCEKPWYYRTDTTCASEDVSLSPVEGTPVPTEIASNNSAFPIPNYIIDPKIDSSYLPKSKSNPDGTVTVTSLNNYTVIIPKEFEIVNDLSNYLEFRARQCPDSKGKEEVPLPAMGWCFQRSRSLSFSLAADRENLDIHQWVSKYVDMERGDYGSKQRHFQKDITVDGILSVLVTGEGDQPGTGTIYIPLNNQVIVLGYTISEMMAQDTKYINDNVLENTLKTFHRI